MEGIEEAAQEVGAALAAVLNDIFGWNLSPSQAFLLVYGGTVVFTWTGESRVEQAAWVDGPNSVLVYQVLSVDGKKLQVTNVVHWAIHELGHVLVNALNNKAIISDTRAFLEASGAGRPEERKDLERRLLYGYAGNSLSPRMWQQSLDGAPSEQFADMFLGWVFNQWETNPNGTLSPAGGAMSNFMNTHMREWLRLAVAN